MMLSNINDTYLDQLHKAKQMHPFVDGNGHKELWDLTGRYHWEARGRKFPITNNLVFIDHSCLDQS